MHFWVPCLFWQITSITTLKLPFLKAYLAKITSRLFTFGLKTAMFSELTTVWSVLWNATARVLQPFNRGSVISDGWHISCRPFLTGPKRISSRLGFPSQIPGFFFSYSNFPYSKNHIWWKSREGLSLILVRPEEAFIVQLPLSLVYWHNFMGRGWSRHQYVDLGLCHDIPPLLLSFFLPKLKLETDGWIYGFIF